MFRTLSRLACAAAFLACAPAQAAEPYPSRPVSIYVGFSAGGAVDTVARALAEHLSASLRQPFVVEAKPGAGSNLAARAVARATPDGYTLLLGTNGLAINMALFKTPGFDVEKDLAPISMVGDIPSVIAANPSFPANNLEELITLAKASPDQYAYATPGNGSLPHLAMALLEHDAGIKLKHVPYQGGRPAVTDAIGGHVPLVVVNALEAAPHIQAGQLKGIAVTGKERLAALPNVATVSQDPRFKSYVAETWWALFAPAGTPKPVLDQLTEAVHKALADPALRQRIESVGGQVQASSQQELGVFVTTERAKWGAVISQTGVTAN
jgi:tripartite-type tricarboxylate transporter receptor subunit TctC